MDLRGLGERAAIERLRKTIAKTDDFGRIDDDSAAVSLDDGTFLLASTDMVIDTTHFLPGVTPRMLGRFAVEIAVSDIAAMGGDAMGVLTAYAMPPETDVEWLAGVSKGMAQATETMGISVIGGDTKRSKEATIAVTALGTVAKGECLLRKGAQDGDALLLTGPVGGPAMGYNMEREADGTLTDRALELVYGVKARLGAGRTLATSGYAHACIDLSDGLAPCLHQMMAASKMKAELHWDDVPLAPGIVDFPRWGVDLKDMALNWGGEYELLAAVDPVGVEPLTRSLGRLGLEPAVVGRVVWGPRKNVIISDRGREPLKVDGFDHFKG